MKPTINWSKFYFIPHKLSLCCMVYCQYITLKYILGGPDDVYSMNIMIVAIMTIYHDCFVLG